MFKKTYISHYGVYTKIIYVLASQCFIHITEEETQDLISSNSMLI